MNNFFVNALFLAIFGGILAIPFLPSKLIRYYSNENVLSASIKKDNGLIKIENVDELSKTIEITVFPDQFVYYDKVFKLENFSATAKFYKIETFINDADIKVKALFSNGENEILLRSGEKTYVDVQALGTKEESVYKVFLKVSAEDIKN